jgi:hypothetical protein
MSAIVDIVGREILDSRGNPTVECDVLLESGTMGRAAVPSGASTGSREAIELRDGDKARYLGQGRAEGRRAHQHRDQRGGARPGRLGAGLPRQDADRPRRHRQQEPTGRQRHAGGEHGGGARRGRRKSACRCTATSAAWGACSLPVPMMNVINGGAHANNNLDLQELMIIPVGAPTFREAVRYGAEVFHALKKIIDGKGMTTAVGDEGGFAPNVASHEAAIQLILEAIDKAGYTAGRTDRHRPGLRRQRVLQGRQVPPGRRRPDAERARVDRHPRHLGRQVPDHQHRRRHARKRLGRLEAAERPPGQEGAAGRRRPVRHQHQDPQEGIEKAWPTRSSSRSTRSAR